MVQKRWKGLLKKEWASMKGWFYGINGASFLFFLVFPFMISFIFKESIGMGVTALLPFWFLLSVFVPASIFIVSLGKEVLRPDIWLHAEVSIFQLFGAKVVFAACIGAVNFVVSLLLLVFQLNLTVGKSDFLLGGAMIQNGVIIVVALVWLSIIVMCIILFFRVLFLVIQPYMKKMSVLIIVIFFLIFSWLLPKITNSEAYQKISQFGPIGSLSEHRFYINEEEGAYFWFGGSAFHVGELVLNIGFITFLFATAALLFEKKVRL